LYEALQIATSGKLKVKAEIYSLDRITDAYGRVASGKVRFPRGYSAHRLTLVSANSL